MKNYLRSNTLAYFAAFSVMKKKLYVIDTCRMVTASRRLSKLSSNSSYDRIIFNGWSNDCWLNNTYFRFSLITTCSTEKVLDSFMLVLLSYCIRFWFDEQKWTYFSYRKHRTLINLYNIKFSSFSGSIYQFRATLYRLMSLLGRYVLCNYVTSCHCYVFEFLCIESLEKSL